MSRLLAAHKRADHLDGSSTSFAPRRSRFGVLPFVLVVILAGCATVKQVQYFEVVYEDPREQLEYKTYYKLTVEGGSVVGPVVYKLKAAYLNSATIDVLEGKGVFVPEVDLPRAADETFKNLLAKYRDALEKRTEIARRRATGESTIGSTGTDPPRSDTEVEGGVVEPYNVALPDKLPDERTVVDLGRQVWLGSLSTGDIVSMGQTQNADPYQFRKLVFYSTAKNIDLEKAIGPQIDSMISKVETLARREQEQSDARSGLLGGVGRMVLGAVGNNATVGGAVRDVFRSLGATIPENTGAPSNASPGASPNPTGTARPGSGASPGGGH